MVKKRTGLIGTLVFHAGLLVFVFLVGLTTPLPLPGEQGILVNFGTEETGFGELEPRISEIPEEMAAPPPSETQPEQESTDETLTQDFEDAPTIEDEPEETVQEQEDVQPVPEENITEEVEETTVPPEEEPREVNPLALYPGSSNTEETSGSEGITEGEGNQGSPTGSESDNYANVLSSGQGGIDFSLAGRNPVNIPKPEYNAQVAGTVVVRIRVNREGQVISAEPGMRGTNITDTELWDAARKAALKASFSAKSDAAYTQTGTITYHFILQ